jgi:RNA polymerase sigma-70 factor (ECF subfamily)
MLDFRTIHDEFRPRILRYLTRLVGRGEAEDLTQQVLVKVSKGLETFRGDSAVSTWLYRIATNAALDRLRSRSAQQATEIASHRRPTSRDTEDEEKPNLPIDKKTPPLETEVIQVEMNACIRQFIADLPENYRTVIVLSDIEGFQNNEIADILAVSLDTVKIRLHRARQQLKKRLEAGCDFYHDERNELACDRKSGGNPPAK